MQMLLRNFEIPSIKVVDSYLNQSSSFSKDINALIYFNPSKAVSFLTEFTNFLLQKSKQK
jgi:hypothetical protein